MIAGAAESRKSHHSHRGRPDAVTVIDGVTETTVIATDAVGQIHGSHRSSRFHSVKGHYSHRSRQGRDKEHPSGRGRETEASQPPPTPPTLSFLHPSTNPDPYKVAPVYVLRGMPPGVVAHDRYGNAFIHGIRFLDHSEEVTVTRTGPFRVNTRHTTNPRGDSTFLTTSAAQAQAMVPFGGTAEGLHQHTFHGVRFIPHAREVVIVTDEQGVNHRKRVIV